jgi:hypothetical protein
MIWKKYHCYLSNMTRRAIREISGVHALLQSRQCHIACLSFLMSIRNLILPALMFFDPHAIQQAGSIIIMPQIEHTQPQV